MENRRPRKVAVVFGTRPEAIKVAPVIHALEAADDLEPLVVSTAQHQDLLDQVLETFGIRAHHDLDIGTPGQTLADITARALERLAVVLHDERPDAVVVQGDTTTAFTAALAGFYADIPVVHVEAGLRTGDPRSPFPEEVNRRLTAHLTALHLAPTPVARGNLLAEGIDDDDIVVTGNTVIDALHWVLEHGDAPMPSLLDDADDWDRVLLVTAHRRESWGDPMRDIAAALADLATADPGLLVAFPMHPNPMIRELMEPAVGHLPNVRLGHALPYGEFARAIARADVILTDSGGVQEEAPSLGKPVLVMRDTTERGEAVDAGTARLVGTDRDDIVGAVRRLFDDPDAYAAMAGAVNPYGDGRAAERTVAALLAHFGRGQRPASFVPARTLSPVG